MTCVSTDLDPRIHATLTKMDPALDPAPAIFVFDLHDANKKK
jgi:hypothetical protein